MTTEQTAPSAESPAAEPKKGSLEGGGVDRRRRRSFSC